jgi:Mg/Co/Ni transporter MgtE
MGITWAKNQSACALAGLMVLFMQGLCTGNLHAQMEETIHQSIRLRFPMRVLMDKSGSGEIINQEH